MKAVYVRAVNWFWPGVPEEYAAADLEEIKARLVEAFTV